MVLMPRTRLIHNVKRLAPKGAKKLRRALVTLYAPPSVVSVEPSYHAVRQQAALQHIASFYGKNPDFPGILLGRSLLDVGCGTAPLGCFFALAGAEVTAIDPNTASLKVAAAYANDFGTPLTFLPQTAEQVLASGMRYDCILALDLLATHPQPGKMMWVLRQLLAPGGVLVVGHTTRSLRAWFVHRFFNQILFKRVAPDQRGWNGFHTPAQLSDLAQASGLTRLAVTLLRYSVSGKHWKVTLNRHQATRYLASFTAEAGQ